MSDILLDNDILLKGAMYGLLHPLLLDGVPFDVSNYRMLGAAKHIVRNKLNKYPPQRGAQTAVDQFEDVVAQVIELEPYDKEIELAAELERLAQQLNVSLDSGESVLCAVLTHRGNDHIFTGDKRAIRAISKITEECADLDMEGRLVCLEQLFLWLLSCLGLAPIRSAVCAEPEVDKTLTICFACQTKRPTPQSCEDGLNSYIASLRREAPNLLSTTG